jgi:NADH dehydrogenase
MSIKQVTVFGGSGFVGRAIVRALAQDGYQVRVACRAHRARGAGSRPRAMSARSRILRTNLRIRRLGRRPPSPAARPWVNASGIAFQRGRQRYQAVHVDGRASPSPTPPRPRASSAWCTCPASAPTSAIRRTSTSAPRSTAEDAIVAGFPDATILRPSVVFGPEDAMFNRMAPDRQAQAPFLPVVGDGVGQGPAGLSSAISAPPPWRCWRTARHRQDRVRAGRPARLHLPRDRRPGVLREIDRHKRIVGVPAGLMRVAGFFAEFLPVPPLTHDQVDLLVTDNVARPGAPGLAQLGIAPTAAEAILPMYLDRYRIGGRYNKHAPA